MEWPRGSVRRPHKNPLASLPISAAPRPSTCRRNVRMSGEGVFFIPFTPPVAPDIPKKHCIVVCASHHKETMKFDGGEGWRIDGTIGVAVAALNRRMINAGSESKRAGCPPNKLSRCLFCCCANFPDSRLEFSDECFNLINCWASVEPGSVIEIYTCWSLRFCSQRRLTRRIFSRRD